MTGDYPSTASHSAIMTKALSGKRILLLAEYGMSGGTRTYVKQLLAFYSAEKARVFMVRMLGQEDPEMADLCRDLGVAVLEIDSIPAAQKALSSRMPLRFFRERGAFRNLVHSLAPDLIVASVGTASLFLGALSLMRHSLLILHAYPYGRRSFLKRHLAPVLYRRLVGNTAVATVSRYAAQEIASQWGLPSLPLVCYSSTGSVVARSAPAGDSMQVLTVGHTTWYKNPLFWIDVAKLLHDQDAQSPVRFVWLGDGALLEDCRQKVREIDAESYIEFRGYDPYPEKEYARSAVYVQPSLIESFGLATLDAMRHGLPAVVSKTGGLPELIADDENGYVVDPGKPEEFARKILELLHDERLTTRMGQAAQERYRQAFSPESCHKCLLRIHKIALGFRE